MSLVRSSSLVIAAVASALIGAALLLLHSQEMGGLLGWLTVGGVALTAGLGLSLVHWMLMGRLLKQVRQLAVHIESLSRGEGKPAASFRPGAEVAELAEVMDTGLGTLRKRIDQLVNQRRELEVQARIAEAERHHAESVLNSISDAVVVTDAFNEIAMVNESAGRILDFDVEQALRKPVDRVIQDSTLVGLIKDTRECGEFSLRRHIEHKLGHGGQHLTYDVTLACVTDDRGQQRSATETAGVVAILRDITKEKEIAEMKSDFVSNVSHELRTPLSSIKAYMEMLVDGEAQDEQTRMEFYNIIQGEANRLSRLIDNILNISRIESGVVKVQREHVALPAVIKDVVDVLLPQARAKQIELVEVSTPLFFQIFADKDMIYQAVLNLMGNAIKYTLPGGKVTIGIQVDEHAKCVNVSVSDTGVGIPPVDLPHLFEKFYRVADHKKLAKGTGLGLNLVKHIIETVHGGKVNVTSQVGKGSTFTFSLPMADSRQ